MPKSSARELKTKAAYNKRPDVQAKRVAENRARRHALAAGTVRKGDHTNIDHRVPLDMGGSGKKGNERVVDESFNKGWRKRQPGMYGKNR